MKTVIPMFFLLALGFRSEAQVSDKPNIIFIIVDDLNDYTETLGGHPQAETPGISRIEESGISFLNAHTSSPKCAPSRTSFITGKDPFYTQVYNNPSCKPFRNYFTPTLGNEEVFTLPEYLKDSAGYFTYGINKIYHCFDSYNDLDTTTIAPCSKSLSWNKFSMFIDGDDTSVTIYGNAHNDGVRGMYWAPIPDSMDYIRYDYRVVDSASLFIQQFANDPSTTCNEPFMIMMGFRKPHLSWYIPEKYYLPYYQDELFAEPFIFPYNQPNNAYPFNGVVMPPQPETIYDDYFNLPIGGLGEYVASWDSSYFNILADVDKISDLPEIDPALTEEERYAIVERSIQANAVLSYLAAVKSVDEQINRLMDSLAAYPEVYSNTIIVLVSDHGFTLGEKRHWQKGTMWETDLRVPFVIADLRNPAQQLNNNPVSLLDIFPTICDMTGVPYPEFSDGSNYLDGHSLYGLIQNPSAVVDKPSLASYDEQGNLQCSCEPMYSVRNSNFHYILYRSNNTAWDFTCDKSSSWTESELYEIGKNRDVDPNEWNNLIHDTAYSKVIDYLSQWLPDSSMYLQIPFTSEIISNSAECLLNNSDTLNLSVILYDTIGNMISAPDNFIYEWTNNNTGEVQYGTNAVYMMQDIPTGLYEAGEKILIYFRMIDPNNNATVSLAHKYFYVNPETEPSVVFSISSDSLTVFISDISITGNYKSITWNFDDGFITHDLYPGPHTYSVNKTYSISCTLGFGNSDSCYIVYQRQIRPFYNDFFSDTVKAFMPLIDKVVLPNFNKGINPDNQSDLTIWPNPADEDLNFKFGRVDLAAEVSILNPIGQVIYSTEIVLHSGNGKIDIGSLPAGPYMIRLRTRHSTRSQLFIVSQ